MDANDRLSVNLTAGEWNSLMTVLGEAPFRVVAPLIQQIQSQCMAQSQDQVNMAQMAGSVPNGAGTMGHPGPFPRMVDPPDASA
jgi:hypothetical protein